MSLLPLRAIALCGLALVAVSCGGGDPAGSTTTATATDPGTRPERLPERLQTEVFEAQQEISAYCRRLALALQGPADPPSPIQRRRAFAAAQRLVDLASVHPYDLVQTGVDVRLFVGDLVEDLGNLNCDPDLIGRLEQGLG